MKDSTRTTPKKNQRIRYRQRSEVNNVQIKQIEADHCTGLDEVNVGASHIADASVAHTRLFRLKVCSLFFDSNSRARGFAIRVDEANVPAEVLRLRTIPGSNDVRERYRAFPAVEVALPPRGLMDARRRLLGGEVFGGRELGWHSSSLSPNDSDPRRVKSSASRASLRTSILHCARDICCRCSRRLGSRGKR